MRNPRLAVLTLALAALALLTIAPTADACYFECVRVAAPFCLACVDVGEYTGVTCQSIYPCGCFFTQNTCSAAPDEPELLAQAPLMTPLAPQAEEAPEANLAELDLLALPAAD